ncbi:histidine acid phosphatase-like protein [Bisporella sp. PMI_857]|nr:histidine acid phosphatase-like protein [Bisporella sp. PMI_857]
MYAKKLLLLSSLATLSATQETVLGVYIFHRHGDRTAKALPPTILTDLGYYQVYTSGDYYRNRYVDANSSSPILGISPDLVKLTQLSVEAPSDTVLQNSAAGFLQGLYPPVGSALGTQQLANGSSVTAPLNGYQLIPVATVSSASTSANAENQAWLQGQSGCNNAIISSNNYFSSAEYTQTLESTKEFFQSLVPVVNRTFTSSYTTFKNAYSVYDLINCATIQNSTIPSSELLTSPTLSELHALANQHEFGLAYNSSEPIRAVAGATLASQIVQQLNKTITGKSKQPIGIQFGAYASFLSFFGLAQLPAASVNFTGIVDYAASMAFELVTTVNASASYPAIDDISIRFLFANGSAAAAPLTAYPLFGQQETTLPWSTFVDEMNKFAIGDQAKWCAACGNSTGVCASTTTTGSESSSTATSSSGSESGSMSLAVAGVIGAFVTLAVILGLEALILLAGGFRIAKKRSGVSSSPETGNSSSGVKA